MTRCLCLLLAICASAASAFAQTVNDPARIDVYVTPFYKSRGPTTEVGAFSKGVAASNEADFVATMPRMRQSSNELRFPEMYVAAIRLYDLGFRKEATYWFYSAEYRARRLPVWSTKKRWAASARPASSSSTPGKPFSS
jgi:hypothetical protein